MNEIDPFLAQIKKAVADWQMVLGAIVVLLLIALVSGFVR